MGDTLTTIPFTVKNVGDTGNIDWVEIWPNADYYYLSLTNRAPEGWTIGWIRNDGTGRTFIRYRSDPNTIAPGQSVTFNVVLHGPNTTATKEATFPAADSDQNDPLVDAICQTGVNVLYNRFGPLPSWDRLGLASSLSAFPISGNVNTQFEVTLTITNRSTVHQANIVPDALQILGTGAGTLLEGPEPAAQDLEVGESGDFKWIVEANSGPDLYFRGRADNGIVSSKVADSNLVPVRNLAAFAWVDPLECFSGDKVRVSVLAQNNTGEALTNVRPSAMDTHGTAICTLHSGPSPAVKGYLAAGASVTFEYEYLVEGAEGETYQFSSQVRDDEGNESNETWTEQGTIELYGVKIIPHYVLSGSSNVTLEFVVTNHSGNPVKTVSIVSPSFYFEYGSCSGGYGGVEWTPNVTGTPPIITFTAPAGAELPGDGRSAYFYVTYLTLPEGGVYSEFLFKFDITDTLNVTKRKEAKFAITQLELFIEATPSSGLKADGVAQSTITVTLTQLGQPVRNAGIFLRTTAGTLSTTYAVTDDSGKAVVTLTAPISEKDVDAVVRAQYLEMIAEVTVSFDAAAPDPSGWSGISSTLPLAGIEVYGNQVRGGIAGMSIATQGYKQSYLAHFDSSSIWWSAVAVANPDNTRYADVNLYAYGNDGALLGTANVQVSPGGKYASLVSSPDLFGITNGKGWIFIDSDLPVVALCVYSNSRDGGIGAMTATQASSDPLIMPHFQTNVYWWTGIAVVNLNTTEQMVALTAYDNGGNEVASMAQPVPAMGKVMGTVSNIMGIEEGTGWIKAESSTAMVGLLVFGNKAKEPKQIAALPAIPLSDSTRSVYFPGVLASTDWWTGLALANPNPLLSADVTLTLYDKDGTQLGSVGQSVGPLQKVVSMAHTLFGLGNINGWVEAQSDQPLVGVEVLSLLAEPGGLAAVEAPRADTRLYLPHYASNDTWWTLIALSNAHDTLVAQTNLTALGNEGGYGGQLSVDIPPNGAIIDLFENLFSPSGG